MATVAVGGGGAAIGGGTMAGRRGGRLGGDVSAMGWLAGLTGPLV